MVGVPGQSKGCNTCRRRKKGCDLQRPECGQCIKGGLVCGGYERERVFINQGFSARKKREVLKPTSEQSARKPLLSSGSGGKNQDRASLQPDLDVFDLNDALIPLMTIIPSGRTYPEWDFSTPIDQLELGHTPRNLFPPSVYLKQPSLSLFTPSLAPVFQAQFMSLFCDTWLPSSSASVGPAFSWLQALPHLHVSDPALSAACAALSTARVGQVTGDVRLEKESLQLYGKGLRKLQEALWDEKRMYNDETLASALVLALYEILECTIDRGYAWMSHTKGAARLVKLRGPKMHTSNLAHKLFLGLRGTAITNAIAGRTATFLAEDDWLTLPFEKFPKNIQHQLYDIMVHIPGILEDADATVLEVRPERQLSKRLSLISRCWILHEKLAAWHVRLLEVTDNRPYWYEPTSSTDPPSFFTPPEAYISFPSLLIANTLCLYWTSLELVYGTMFFLYNSLPPTFDKSFLRLLDMEGEQDVRRVAINILQSAEFFLKSEMGGFGLSLMLFPLRVAMQYFLYFPGAEEAQWCFRVFEKMGEMGVPFGKFLTTVKPENWPTANGSQVSPQDVFGDGSPREVAD